MRNIKVSWHVSFVDHDGYTLYSPILLANKVREAGDHITRIHQVVTEWYGDWDSDDNPRRFVELSRVDITDTTMRLVAA